MGRVKEQLLQLEYLEVMNNQNDNLKEYLLTMSSEYIPEAYEQDNYHLIKYSLLDLRSLEAITISEKITSDKLEHEIPKQLAKIIHETNFSIDTYNRISYKALINNGWLSEQYLFEAIPIAKSISSLKDLIIIPSSEKAIKYYLYQISDSLQDLNSELYQMKSDINDSLNSIDKALDLMNYLAQG